MPDMHNEHKIPKMPKVPEMSEMLTSYPSDSIKAITEFLFLETPYDEIEPSDLVLVLGNDMIDGTMAEVKKLLDDGKIKADAIVLLSGATGTLNEGKEKECIRLFHSGTEHYGIPAKQFVLEDRAKNAFQNFLYSEELIQTLGGFSRFEKILCIGKAFLLRRASMYAAKLGYPLEKMQYYGTVDREGRNIGKDCWWKNPRAVERVLAEIKRIGEYGLAGDLSIQ